MEILPCDTGKSSCFGHVALGGAKYVCEIFLLEAFACLSEWPNMTANVGTRVFDGRESEVARRDRRAVVNRDCTFYRMLEFAYVAWPSRRFECRHGLGCKRARVLSEFRGKVVQKIKCQCVNIVGSLAQWRDTHPDDVDAIKKVLPKTPRLGFGFQVLVCRTD